MNPKTCQCSLVFCDITKGWFLQLHILYAYWSSMTRPPITLRGLVFCLENTLPQHQCCMNSQQIKLCKCPGFRKFLKWLTFMHCRSKDQRKLSHTRTNKQMKDKQISCQKPVWTSVSLESNRVQSWHKATLQWEEFQRWELSPEVHLLALWKRGEPSWDDISLLTGDISWSVFISSN